MRRMPATHPLPKCRQFCAARRAGCLYCGVSSNAACISEVRVTTVPELWRSDCAAVCGTAGRLRDQQFAQLVEHAVGTQRAEAEEPGDVDQIARTTPM